MSKLKSLRHHRHLLFIIALLTTITLTPLAIYISRTPKEAEAAWYSGGTGTWIFRKKLVIDHTKVGDGADLTNYPVLLAYTFPELKDHAQADGDDIMFTSSDGTTQLDHEIDYYDPTSGQVYFWIEIPTLDYDGDTTIYMYYGNPTVSAQEDQAGTWGDSRFSGVYHLSETPVEGVTSILDSDSDNASDCTPIDYVPTDPDWDSTNSVGTPTYKGLEFISSGNRQLYLDCGDTAEFDVGTGNFSLLVRWNLPEGETANMSIIDKTNGGLSGTYTGWVWSGRLDLGSDNTQLRVQDGDGSESYVAGTNDLDTGSWMSLAVSADRSGTSYSYFNGSQDGSSSITNEADSLDNAQPLKIGKNYTNDPRFKGVLDEIWIIKGEAVSSGFANTFHNNLNDPTSFFKFYGSPQQQVDPILYWKLDEGSGTTINDSSSSNNPGTSSGATWETIPSNCITTNCLSFDGTNDVVTITTANDTDVDFTGSENFSGSAWVYVTSMPTSTASDKDMIMGKWDDNSNQAAYRLYVENDDSDSTGNMAVQIYDESAGQAIVATGTTDAIAQNTWYHVAFTFNGGTAGAAGDLKLYVNGLYSAQNTQNTSFLGLEDKASDFTVGDYDTNDSTAGNTAFAGRIDEVKVYDELRTDAEIKTDYIQGASDRGSGIAAGIGGTSMPNPNIWWRLDEGSGATANNSGSTGSGDNGSITGGTWTTSGKYDKALTFSASTSVSDTITDPGNTNSLSLWVYPTSSVLSKTLITSGKLATNGSGQPTYGTCTGTALPLNTWTHIVAVSNGAGSCTLYQNGVATNTNTGGVTFGTSVNVGGSSFTGIIDEVKIYDDALSADQVKVDFNADSAINIGSGVNERTGLTDGDYQSSLVGYWPMDENVDNSCTGGSNDVCDRSSNSNNGANNASPTWVPGKFGSALYYTSGSSQYTSITGPSGVKTVSFWINPQDNSEPMLNITSTTDYITSSSGTVTATGFTSPSIYVNGILNGTITDNYWNHVVVASDTAENASALYFGRANSSYLTGSVDEVRLFSSKLTQAQVAYEFSRGKPIAWYRLDECAGSVANDASEVIPLPTLRPNGTITIGGTGTYTTTGNCVSGTSTHAWYAGATGKMGSALGFDDTNDYITIADQSMLDLTNGLSITAWVKPAANEADNVIVSKGTSYEMGISATGALYWDGVGAQVDDGKTYVGSGTWHHVAVTNNDTTATYYVDGVQSGTSAAGVDTDNATALYIGYDGTNFFDGLIDDVQIFNYPLSATQIRSVMNGGSVRFE